MNIFFYLPYLFMTGFIKFAGLVAPALKTSDNYKKMAGGFWTYRLYMEEMKSVDLSTYWFMVITPNALLGLVLLMLLLSY